LIRENEMFIDDNVEVETDSKVGMVSIEQKFG